jgi:prepilin-type N-terminal cleavage/methylation domain-containing protein
MTIGLEPRRIVERKVSALGARQMGFSLIELLIGMSIMALGLLSIATMFSTGYTSVTHGGRTTMATSAARQILEDMQAIPFNSLGNLNGFNTATPGTLPVSNPERDLARKWRYALAGEEAGWPAYTAAEKAMWSSLTISDGASNVPLGATGQIAVVAEGGSASLMRVTVTVTAPRRPALQIATLISRL